ncbi:MAG: PepSY-associated TM helix domain-containing protein [Egibacteraceae bacterium]
MIVWVHRWLGLVLGAWVLCAAATGFVLIFRDQINFLLHADRYATTPGDLGPQAALDAAHAAHPGWSDCGLSMPAMAGGVYSVCMEEPDHVEDHRVLVDPGTATVTGSISNREGVLSTVYRLHSGLLVDDVFGVGGSTIVGWLGVAWLVLLLSGSAAGLTQRVRRWWHLVRVRRVRRAQASFRFAGDLHRMLGLALIIPLALIVLTGIGIAFRTPPGKERVYEPPKGAAVKSAKTGAEPLGADKIARLLERRYPDDTLAYLDVPPPERPRAPVIAYLSTGYDPGRAHYGHVGNMMVLLDRYTGRELWVGDPSELSAWTRLSDLWTFPIHAGSFGRTPTRVLWMVIAVGACLSVATGCAMRILRHRPPRKQRRPTDPSRGSPRAA